jgi:hypothetical protein
MTTSCEFTCMCGKSRAWVSDGSLTNPCPICGRVYRGQYSAANLTIDAVEVGIDTKGKSKGPGIIQRIMDRLLGRTRVYRLKPGMRFHSEYFNGCGTVTCYRCDQEWYFLLDGTHNQLRAQCTPDKVDWIAVECVIPSERRGSYEDYLYKTSQFHRNIQGSGQDRTGGQVQWPEQDSDAGGGQRER